MKWLHEHGLVSSFEDYLGLPVSVLQDARMVMTAEAAHATKQARAAERAERGGVSGNRR